MKNYMITLIFVCIGQLAVSQTVYPTPEESSYTVSSGETITIADSESITLKPNTHIQSGANFTAKLAIAVPYAHAALSNDKNYVFTQTFQEEITYFDQDYAEESAVIETVTYHDGLGRPIQKIYLKATADKKDIVTHIGYDPHGRQDKEWLPYTENAGEAGSFKSGDIETATKAYYTAHYPEEINASYPNPFSEKKFEDSPLNRVSQQAAPGYDWRLGGGHEITHDHLVNTNHEVRLFTVTFAGSNTESPQLINTTTSYYNAGALYKTITKDENWTSGTNHTNETFKDKQGRVVLKRTYAPTSSEGLEAHDTYYVYDDFGNLSYILPPKVDTTDGVDATELNELCYQYRYDHRNRLIEKKIPGKGWEYMVYNKLDQPIMTQDANQRANNEWLFTKYDAFGRVAFTGLHVPSATVSRATMQDYADDNSEQFVTKQNNASTLAGTVIYYDNGTFPTEVSEILTINYYDDYNFDRAGIAAPGTVFGEELTGNAQSLATGTKVRVLGTDDWITTATWYDKKGRPIYVVSGNAYLNTKDIVEHELDFTGRVGQTRTTHIKHNNSNNSNSNNNTGITLANVPIYTTYRGEDGTIVCGTPQGSNTAIITVDQFEYDHMGRLIKHTQKINDQKEELIAHNTYDNLGQLVQKKVGNTESNPLQTIDYTYNVRGWLQQINNPANLGSDLFAFGINYNTVTHGGTPLYNGNIAETQWRTANRDNSLKWYAYGYDPLNRIVSATDNTGKYNLSNITYDKMGNLLTLQRQGHTNSKATSFGAMDRLAYTYDNGNKLLKVQDNGNDSYGFRDGANQTVEFTYDTNGNLLTDANKSITDIQWNYLNMPIKIKFNNANNKVIDYIYAADSTKVRKIANVNGNIITTDYARGHQYVNGGLQFINNIEDGYVFPKNDGTYSYVYYYTDQLDNIRLMYSDANRDGRVTTDEIIKESHFYPFGMVHKGYNNVVNSIGSSLHKYDYQNQERQDELGLNWLQFKYRMHDPSIGRFVSIDPLAEGYIHNSTYAFAENKVIKYNELEGLEITLNKFDKMSYENRSWLGRAATFVGNAAISFANSGIYMFNYAGDLDRADQALGGFGKGAGSKFLGDVIQAKATLADYASNTSFEEMKADMGNMLSDVETYENLVGGLVGIGTIGKTSKWLSSSTNITITGKRIGGSLIRGRTFAQYKAARGGTQTLAKILTPTGVQRISTEFHHVFLTQSMQRAYKLPNWMVNNRLNVWKLNTVQHSLIDRYRYNFLRAGFKPNVGWFKKYNWFTKF